MVLPLTFARHVFRIAQLRGPERAAPSEHVECRDPHPRPHQTCGVCLSGPPASDMWRGPFRPAKRGARMPPIERAERTDRERLKAVDLAVGQIEKQFGKGSIMRLGQNGAIRRIGAIPTGAISIDFALGVGGVPRGRVIEIFGPESSGKTTLALQVIAEAQRGGGMAAFVDAEHALDPMYAKKLGVDVDNLLVSQPHSCDRAREISVVLVR